MGSYFQRLAQRTALAPAALPRHEAGKADLALEQDAELPASPAAASPPEREPSAPEVSREHAARPVAAPHQGAASASVARAARIATVPPEAPAAAMAAAPPTASATSAAQEVDAMATDTGRTDSPKRRQARSDNFTAPRGRNPGAPLMDSVDLTPHRVSPPPVREPETLAAESAADAARAPGFDPAPAPARVAADAASPATARLTAEAKPRPAPPGSVERTQAAAPPAPEGQRQPRAVEVRIGSVTVEIHQAPAPPLAAPVPPAPRRERVAAFSASRHYLRGD